MKYFKKIKDYLYPIKGWHFTLFKYPDAMSVETDYDAYWADKRKSGFGSLSDWQLIRANIIKKALAKERNISLVDIGCGDGGVLDYLSKHLSVKSKTGVDISQKALSYAEKKFGIQTIQADIRDASFIKRILKHDYTLLLEALEHVPESEIFLREFYQKAKKGIFFSFPNTGFILHRLRLLFGRFPLQWRVSPGEHLRFWTKKDLFWWLEKQNYQNYKVHYYKGVPLLNKIWPSLFAAAFLVELRK